MPPAVVTVWFDYACPHSYIGLKQLEETAAEIGFEIERRPFLLRQDSVEEPLVQRGVEIASEDPRRRPLYRPGESVGTEPASNRSVSTLAVHAATAYAKELKLDREFFWAASKEYWESGTDLGNLYTLRRLATSIGLGWQEMWPKLESGDYHRLVLSRHEDALASGVTRTPSMQIGDRLHSGPIDRDELHAAVLAG
jgi:predicted DsbA family dithiol-disulfide isomerase